MTYVYKGTGKLKIAEGGKVIVLNPGDECKAVPEGYNDVFAEVTQQKSLSKGSKK